MSPSQLQQAEQFRIENQAVIAAAQANVLAAAARFLLASPANVLPSEVITSAESALQRSDIAGFNRTIRPLAPKFVDAGASGPFWDVVDAANFFSDATGSNWPYMTMALRAQSLVWANEHAAAVI